MSADGGVPWTPEARPPELELLFALSPDSIWVMEPATPGRILDCNAVACTMHGYERETLLGEPYGFVNPGFGRVETAALFEEVAARGQVEIETTHRREDGRIVPVECTFRRTRIGDRDVIVSIDHDLTERKQAMRMFRQSEERFRRLVEMSPGAIIVYQDGDVAYANHAAAILAGAGEPSELVGKPIETFMPEETWKAAEQGTIDGDQMEPVRFVEGQLARFDGSGVPVEVAVGPTVFAGRGAMQALFRDITDRKQAEQAMVEAQKLESLGILAGGVAHDFNNLLVGILGNADLALLTLAKDSRAHELVSDMKQAGQRAAELARQMMSYSGKTVSAMQEVDLNLVAREVPHLLRTSMAPRADLIYALDEEIPLIAADPTQVRQIVMNLVLNASDAIGDATGEITIRTGRTGGPDGAEGTVVFIEVADTGVGMDEATRGRVFEPFFTTKFKGRGLGLAAVRGIVRGHGGTVSVASAPGEGTTFRVSLPALDGTGDAGARRSA